MRALLEIRRRQVNEAINMLRFQMDEAAQGGDMRSKEYEEDMAHATQTLRNLHQAREKFITGR